MMMSSKQYKPKTKQIQNHILPQIFQGEQMFVWVRNGRNTLRFHKIMGASPPPSINWITVKHHHRSSQQLQYLYPWKLYKLNKQLKIEFQNKFKSMVLCWAWWCMPVISALRRQRQVDFCIQFKVILVYKVRSRTARAIQRNPVLKKTNKQRNALCSSIRIL